MKKVILHPNHFDENMYWPNELKDVAVLDDADGLDLFDQNGYHLTKIEQAYGEVNGYPLIQRRHETVLRQNWMTMFGPKYGAHFNHCDLFERKGYSESAKEQLLDFTKYNPLLWKLVKLKPKYGIDVSIDYVDDKGNVFEVFHFEWDSFEYDAVVEKKKLVEEVVLGIDWDEKAVELLDRKEEWYNLEFFEQSKWRTDFFGLPPEKFKQVIWEE